MEKIELFKELLKKELADAKKGSVEEEAIKNVIRIIEIFFYDLDTGEYLALKNKRTKERIDYKLDKVRDLIQYSIDLAVQIIDDEEESNWVKTFYTKYGKEHARLLKVFEEMVLND